MKKLMNEEMEVRQKILENAEDCIPYDEFNELCERIEQKYNFSHYRFWMWKIFQFGFAFGKRAERSRKKKTV